VTGAPGGGECTIKWRNRGWALGCWASLDLSRRAKLIEALGRFREASSFLELGCHVGSNLRLLAIALGPERLTGLDVNKDAIALGQALFTEERVDNVTLESGEFLSALPRFPDDSEDVVFSCYALAYVHPGDLARVIGHMLRIARLGLVVAEPQVRSAPDRRRVRHRTFEWNHDYWRTLRRLGIRSDQLRFTDLEVDERHKMNAILTVTLATQGRAVQRRDQS